MKSPALFACAVMAAALSYGNAASSAPTKDIVQPGGGLASAQESCPKYAGDETREVACVLFHAGAIKKMNGQYQVNVQMLQPAGTNPGHVMKCKAEMIHLPDGGIGWKETGDCY